MLTEQFFECGQLQLNFAAGPAAGAEDPPSVSLVPRIRETPFFAMFSGMHKLAGDRRSVRETTRDLAEVRIPTGAEGDMRMGDLRDPTSLRFTARALQDLDPE